MHVCIATKQHTKVLLATIMGALPREDINLLGGVCVRILILAFRMRRACIIAAAFAAGACAGGAAASLISQNNV